MTINILPFKSPKKRLKIVGKGVLQDFCEFCSLPLKNAVIARYDGGNLFSICQRCIPKDCDNRLDKILSELDDETTIDQR
jgi:hypothetical protein